MQGAKRIFAAVRGVTLGQGQGTAKNLAKKEAAKEAVGYLEEKGLPGLPGLQE